MRHLTLVSLLSLLLLAVEVTAQPISKRVDGAEFHEVYSGERWKVFSTKEPAGAKKAGVSQMAASLRDPEAETFVVFPALAVDDLAAREILSKTEAREVREDLAEEGLDYLRVTDVHVVHLEGAKEAAEKAAGLSPTSPMVADKSCFGWQDPETFSDSWTWTEGSNFELFNIDQESFDGNVTVSLPLSAEINGTIIYQVKEKFCIPYKFRLIEASLDGEVGVQGSIVASAQFSYTEEWNWKEQLLNVSLGDFVIWVGVIPVYLEFNLPVEVGLDAMVKASGRAEVRADLNGTASFNVLCTSSECDGLTNFEQSFNIADPSYEFTLDANARVWARAAIEMEIYDEDVGLVSAGATGFVQAHLFGYLGNLCGDLDEDGSGDTLEDLLLDADAGYNIDVSLSGFLLPDRKWTLLEGFWHLRLWDLWDDSEGWNLADPVILGPTLLDAGQPARYEFMTRPCYPYPDDLNYQWTGPVTGAGAVTPRTGTLRDAAVPPVGDHLQHVTAVSDTHGREFNISRTKPLTVFDPYGGTQTLLNGVVESDLSGTAGSRTFYAVDVPEGATDLTVELSGGTGNANLYVRRDTRPTLSSFDCRSANSDNTESCSFPLPEAGRYHVMLSGETAYSGGDLVASFVEPTSEELVNESPELDLAGSDGSKSFFTLEVPDGANDLSFELSGGTGDADLYVRRNTWPGLSAFDCRSLETGNDDRCDFPNPQSGIYYVMIFGAADYSQANLIASYTAPGGELSNGVPETNLAGNPGSRTFYTIDVPLAAHDLTFALSDGTGDADIFVRFNVPPSTLVYDCHSWNAGNSDSCTFASPQPGRYHVLVHGHADYSGASLVAAYTDAEELTRGVPETLPPAMESDQTFYTFEVPEEAADLMLTLLPGSGDPDLFVRFEAQPDRENLIWDCQSQEPEHQVDSCTIPSPKAGRYHVLVYAFSDYSDVRLIASYVEPVSDGVLSNGTRAADLAGARDSQVFFTLEVPADATDFTVSLLGGSGDADLYVRHGLQPSLSAHDCRSWEGGNADSCYFPDPAAGTFHILVYGYSTYSEVSLTASYRRSAGGGGELTRGIPESDLSGDADVETFYTLEVPEGATDLDFTLWGGTGDADLYVRFGEQPSALTFDCRSWETLNNHTCSFSTPQTGTYHILMHAYSPYSGVNLIANYTLDGGSIFRDGFESGVTASWSEP